MEYTTEPDKYASTGYNRSPKSRDTSLSNTPYTPVRQSGADDFLSSLIGGQLRYDFLTADTIRQLVYERKALRDKNRGAILGLMSDLTGDISRCENLNSAYSINPDAGKRLSQLQQTKLDLEKQLLGEDVDLWRDTFMLKRDLVEADKKYSSAKLRTGLLEPSSSDDTKQSPGSMGPGYM